MIKQDVLSISYEQFLAHFSGIWEVGDHVAIIGQTDSGKTYVAQDIKKMRHWVVVIATKSKDDTLEGYTDYLRKSNWPPDYGETLILFWRRPKTLTDLKGLQTGIYKIMDHLYRYGGWTIYFDDLFFVSETLKLKSSIRMFYTQVRSANVSIVASIQRPAWIPVEALSQSKYFIIFSVQDENDIKRIAEAIGVRFISLLKWINLLGRYEFLLLSRHAEPILVRAKGAA